MGQPLTRPDPPLVSVVLVTWNSAPYLRACLDALAAQTWAARELVVIDNASEDDSAAIAETFATRTIRNPANRGFSAAVNQGIAASGGEFVLLLNPDCRMSPDYIERLVSALTSAGERFGSATGCLLRAEGDAIAPLGGIDSLGIRMTRSGRHLDIEDERMLGGAGDIVEIFGVSGAAAMFRRRFLEDVVVAGEIFDEDFFAYREDADLAWRGQLMGWRALVEKRAIAWHVRRVTPAARRELPSFINMHSVKNRFLLRLKNEGAGLMLRHAPFELARDLIVLGACLTVERSSLPAFTWLLTHRRSILAKRRLIQRRRRVADRELARWFR